MPTFAEELAAKRSELAATVQEAVLKFESATGFAVTGFTILHHYTGRRLDPSSTLVTNVTLEIE